MAKLAIGWLADEHFFCVGLASVKYLVEGQVCDKAGTRLECEYLNSQVSCTSTIAYAWKAKFAE